MLKVGKYKHFKGNIYMLLSTAEHSETNELYCVYQEMLNENVMPNGKIWIRPFDMWIEKVVWPDGETKSRFMYIGE